MGKLIDTDGLTQFGRATINPLKKYKATYDTTPATKAHAVDSFVYFNNVVYKVTSAIAIGDTIAVGTNISADTGLVEGTQMYIDNLPGDGGGGSSKSTVTVTTEISRLYGETVTVTDGNETLTGTFSDSGRSVFEVSNLGTYTVTCDIYTKSVSVETRGNAYTIAVAPKIVSWSTGSDADVVALVAAADKGDIDLYDDAGWRVGDERTISLAAMEAMSPLTDTHVAQDTTWVLMHNGLYKKASDNSDVNFVVGMKDCLTELGAMYDSNNYTSTSWKDSPRRTWCNSTFKNAVPSSIRDIFKQVKVTTATGINASSNDVTNDYFFLSAEKEIQGVGSVSNSVEYNALTQFDWYKTSGNKLKEYNFYPYYWNRSPRYNVGICLTNASDGSSTSNDRTDGNFNLSVHACI